MEIVASAKVTEKIRFKHGVSFLEVEEAWFLHSGHFLEDTREEHRTRPPTLWFISETIRGRVLKLVIIPHKEFGIVALRTAYEPNDNEIDIYEKTK